MLIFDPLDSGNPGALNGLRGNWLEGSIWPVNVGQAERYISILGGAALAVAGLSRRNLPGLLLAAVGGLFMMRGVSGHCRLYESIGVSTAATRRRGVPDRTGHKIEKRVLIARPPGDSSSIGEIWRTCRNSWKRSILSGCWTTVDPIGW